MCAVAHLMGFATRRAVILTAQPAFIKITNLFHHLAFFKIATKES